MGGWEIVSETPRLLQLRIYEGGGWLVLLAMLAFAGGSARLAWKKGPIARFAKLVPSIMIAVVGAVVCAALVREVELKVDRDAGTIAYVETKLPGRVVHRGGLRIADVASIATLEVPGRRGKVYKLGILGRDGVDHVPDRSGTPEREPQEKLAERLRAFLAQPR